MSERARRDGQKKRKQNGDKLKITAATSAAAAAAAASSSSSTSSLLSLPSVNVENKCALAAPTAFSYQRATKRCARLDYGQSAAATRETEAHRQQTTATPTPTNAQCEPSGSRTELLRLAKHKAQLRAAFYRDIYALGVTNDREAKQQPPQQEQEQHEALPRVRQLIGQYNSMIVKQQQQQQEEQPSRSELKPIRLSNSDEGCTAGLSPCSSDNEDAGKPTLRKPKVARCASSDSALGLEVDDASMEAAAAMAPPIIQRRMTLTVTDLPLRPALLPLAEPTALADSPVSSPTGAAGSVPSKVLLEERLVGIAQEPRGSITLPTVSAPIMDSSRRESTQSCISELGGVRYVRTPSVVVSDYSDDITACGISMEEMEYFRMQRMRGLRRCSLDAGGPVSAAGGSGPPKDGSEAQSDVSAASSCSNLYYCGSTISALDGGECMVNGVRVALARQGSHSSSDDGDDDDDEQQQQQLSELLAATQLDAASDGDGDAGATKKVGSSSGSNSRQSDGDSVTIIGNLNLD